MLPPMRALPAVLLFTFLPAALRAQDAGAESLSSAQAVLVPANLAPADRFGESVTKSAKTRSAATVQGQLWYRDPLSTSNQTTSLSDAVEFVVGL